MLKMLIYLAKKTAIDKLDIGSIRTAPVDLSKLGDEVKNQVVKKSECNEWVKKVNDIKIIDTSNLI